MAAKPRVRKMHRPVDDQMQAKIQDRRATVPAAATRSHESSPSPVRLSPHICPEAGITFDRTKTEAAVRAHGIDLDEDRALLAKMMLAEVQEQLDILNAPYIVWSFGGMDGEIHSHLLESAPMMERNTALRSAGAAAFAEARRRLAGMTGSLT